MGTTRRTVLRAGGAVLAGAAVGTTIGGTATAAPGEGGFALTRLPVPDGTWRSWAGLTDPTGRHIVGTAVVGPARASVQLRWDGDQVALFELPPPIVHPTITGLTATA